MTGKSVAIFSNFPFLRAYFKDMKMQSKKGFGNWQKIDIFTC